ncbi:MAG TPA: histidine kinase [Longimicrobium sp.]|jgi:signal transduction histidine kinase
MDAATLATDPTLPAAGGPAEVRAEPGRGGPLGLSWREWLLVLAFWTAVGVLESVKTYFSPSIVDEGRNWLRLLAANVPWWHVWALFTPLVFLHARLFPLTSGRLVRSALLHFACAVPIALVHIVAGTGAWWLVVGRHASEGTFRGTLEQIASGYLISDVMVYWAIVGAYTALDYRRRYRERELEAARLAVRAARLEASVTEARLSALRMELNPHFLFNTLNSVAGLVRRRENDQAVGVLATLGELLRITLGQREQEVPLELELDFLRRYLEIERVRFHDRLTVEVDVPAPLLHHPVPSLVLQPLVENAVRHGIALQPGPGRLAIRAARRGGELVLEVSDTGPGPGAVVRGGGVGLKNTRERLTRLYGERAALRLEAAPGGGTRAVVTLPLSAQENSDACVA